MKRFIGTLFALVLTAPIYAAGFGFGIQAGAFSPTSGLDDNDNGVAFGAHIKFKFAVIGVKAELFWVDSSGRYDNILGENFNGAQLDVETILAGDVMFYPAGGLFFLQAGLNFINVDEDQFDSDVIDNELGLELGAGITFFDKLMVQGKVMYTPDAIRDEALDTLRNLDDADMVGYLVTVGWNF